MKNKIDVRDQRGQIWRQVYDKVRGQVWNQVWDLVSDQVGVKDQVVDQVWSHIYLEIENDQH